MSRKNTYIIKFLGLVAGLLLLNIWAGSMDISWDFTEDKRYTLTRETGQTVASLEEEVEVTLLLAEPLPAGLKRLKVAAENMLEQFNRINSLIDFQYIDPTEGTVEEVNRMKEELSSAGIYPVNIRMQEEDEMREKLVYPYAVFVQGDRQFAVSLLEEEGIDLRGEVQLNNSVSLLEYKFVNALDKLSSRLGRLIGFTVGHGELNAAETADIRQSLAPLYQSGQLILDSVDAIPSELELVIVAKPTRPFSDRDKALLDQYIMMGGRVIFAIDRLAVNLDSIGRNKTYVPHEYDLRLDDLLFKYGLRIGASLVQDLECSRIPLAVGRQGGRDQIEMFQWFYHPLALPSDRHEISRNLDRVNLLFANPIDTLKTGTGARKEVLLTSSPYARVQGMPNPVGFEILRYPPEEGEFDHPFIPLGVLVEGPLNSLYENRLLPGDLGKGGGTVSSTDSAAVILFSDGDLLRSAFDPNSGDPRPLGYNLYERRQFANKALVMNAIEYMMDKKNILRLRNREVRLRLIDRVAARQEKTKWQFVNIGLPLMALALFGIIFQIARRRKYAMRYEYP